MGTMEPFVAGEGALFGYYYFTQRLPAGPMR